MKIATNFFRKKRKKTIYLERCRYFQKSNLKPPPTSTFFDNKFTKKSI